MTWGVIWIARGLDSPGAMIFVCGAAIIGVILIDRMRVSEEVRRRAEVLWVVSDERLAVNTGGKQEQFEWGFITQMFRTLDGFMMWRRDGFTMWLPNTAFPSADAVEEFARIAQLKIHKYNHAT